MERTKQEIQARIDELEKQRTFTLDDQEREMIRELSGLRAELKSLARREEWAELVILEKFDELRERAGHDYGSGQRFAEISRRRRELDLDGSVLHHGEIVCSAAELADAFDRVGRPRLARAEDPGARRGFETPTSKRTVATWRTLERRIAAEPRELKATRIESPPEHRIRVEPALAMGGYAVFCSCGNLTGFAGSQEEADEIGETHLENVANALAAI